MSYETRAFNLGDEGYKRFGIGAARLASLQGEGGTVVLNNRGTTFAEGDRDVGEEELLAGTCEVVGSPNSKVTVIIRR